MKERFESYSNLAYNLVGMLALLLHGDLIACLGLQALGVASYVYHSRKTKPIYLFDWWAMGFLNIIVAGLQFNDDLVWAGLITFHVLYSYVLLGKLTVYLEVAISSSAGLLAIYLNRSFETFLVVVTIFAVALIIRAKDEDPKQLKFHDSVWHSLWHILTAAGYYVALYLNI